MQNAHLLDPYTIKNRDFITSHKLKLFNEDPWTYYLKYVLCEIPPYRLRHPDMGDGRREALLIGQAVDDYLTFGKEYYDEHYIVMQKRIPDVEPQLAEVLATIEEGYMGFTHAMLKKLEAKRDKLAALAGKIQLTATMQFAVEECIFEASEQTMFHKGNYEKADIIIDIPGLPFKLKGELDHRSPDKKLIRDVKTTANLETFEPEWYTWQMSFYHWINEEETGERAEVVLDVMEKPTPSRPFSRSMVIQYSQATLMRKRGEILATLERLKRAHELGIYPKPSIETQMKSQFYGHNGYGRHTQPIIY